MTNLTDFPAPFARHYALFLDVDGTLADFHEDPNQVFLPAVVLERLLLLQRQLNGAVALISGRGNPDLERLTGGGPLCCMGLHGLTQNNYCPGGATTLKQSPEIITLRQLSSDFCRGETGVTVEDKEFGLALHYRRSPQSQAAVQQFAQDYLQRRQGESDFVILEGKMVVEFKPAGADKGVGISRLLQHAPFKGRVPLFIGDDVTDEAGFAAVNRARGVSVKCGEGPTRAQYRLPDVAAVRQWLEDYSAWLALPDTRPDASDRIMPLDMPQRIDC